MIDDPSRFVGSVPENYDKYLVPHIFQEYAEDLARRVQRRSPSSLLELAAGTGVVTRRIRDLLPNNCEIVATDLNEPMLEIARKRFGPEESIEFRQADATALPFTDAGFDVVACQFGVMFFPDKQRGYAEVFRVLEPGGAYLFNVWDSLSENPFAEFAHEVVAKFFPDDPPGFYQVPFHYHDVEQIRSDVSAAGFVDVTIERLPVVSAISSAADFAKGLVFGNPLNEEILSRGGDPDAVCTAIAQALEQDVGSKMPLSALIVEAVKE